MNNTQRSLLLGERNGHGDDLDSLLRRFFRSEMPKNWPAPPRVAEPPRTQPRRPARSWYRWTSRLALAAAVSFFLIGYLTLANLFPSGERRNGEPLKPLISH